LHVPALLGADNSWYGNARNKQPKYMKKDIENVVVRYEHYDEFAIDQHAFGSSRVEATREMFNNHINECCRCRLFYEDLKSFYQNIGKAHPEINGHTLPDNGTFQLTIPKNPDTFSPKSMVKFAKTLPFRLKDFVFYNKKPLLAGFSFACLLLCAILAPSYFLKDNNPEYMKFNQNTRMIETYNRNWNKLWELVFNGNSYNLNKIGIDQACQIVDLDGDGKKEFVSVLTKLGKNESGYNIIQIFNYKGELIKSKEFGETFCYLNEPYFKTFYTWGMLVDNFENNREKEIILTIHHLHSPSVVIRLDKELNILGKYWHYGHLDHMYSLDLNNDNRKKLVMTGFEDKSRTAAIVTLNPLKITGTTEASQTSGYGFTHSNAEVFYIRLPLPKEMNFLETRPMTGPAILESLKDSILCFEWLSNVSVRVNPDNKKFENVLYYYFTRDMKPVQIHSTDISIACYNALLKEGKIKKLPDKKYFDNLIKEIEYWDGKEWKKEWCKVGSSMGQ
jgi:hypothetical protein